MKKYEDKFKTMRIWELSNYIDAKYRLLNNYCGDAARLALFENHLYAINTIAVAFRNKLIYSSLVTSTEIKFTKAYQAQYGNHFKRCAAIRDIILNDCNLDADGLQDTYEFDFANNNIYCHSFD